jgi:hypothetical protein
MTTLIPKYDLKNGGSTPTGAINRPFNDKLEEFISVKDFGAVGNGVTDDSTAFTNTLNAVIDAGGGTIYIPQGTYVIDLDWSTQVIAQDYGQIIIQGSGIASTLLLGKTGSTALLTINRGGSGDNYLGSQMVFRDLEFRTESNICNGGTPVIPYAVQIIRSSAEFYNVSFSGGARASYYGVNSQYAKFIDCKFQCSSLVPSGGYPSAGCWIQSSYNQTVADQMTFDRCNFVANQNGLYIQGCQNLRVLNSMIQLTFEDGEGGIVIKDYLDGGGSEGILIDACHFEINYVRDIYLPSQTSRTQISNCVFGNAIGQWPTKVATVEQTSTHATYVANDFRTASGPTIVISGDAAQLVYIGNDKSPYSLTYTGSNPQALVQATSTTQLQLAYATLEMSGFWGKPGLLMGGSYLWVDTSNRLRIKSGSLPTSDTDGVVVGTQT